MKTAAGGLRSGLVAPLVLCVLLVAGCVTGGPGEPARSRDEVGILVAPPPQVRDGQAIVGCAAALIEGTLVADTGSGVVLVAGGTPTPIVWPAGYSARRVGSEVQVLDVVGRVVATTCEAVQIGGGAIDGAGIRWWACDKGITPVANS